MKNLADFLQLFLPTGLTDDMRLHVCRRLFVVNTVIKFVQSFHTVQSCHVYS